MAAAAAAGWAGGNAEAAVVYTDPDTLPTVYPTGGVYATNTGIDLDFNGDSPDNNSNTEIFVGSLSDSRPVAHVLKRQEANPLTLSNGAAPGSTFFVIPAGNDNPAALAADTLIGPGSTFGNAFDITPGGSEDDAVLVDEGGNGNFTQNSSTTQYVGVRFAFRETPTEIHYGWIGVRNMTVPGGTGEVTDWAYESTPNTAIAAGVPEPTGLALLALGGAGLIARPRKRT